MRIVRRNHKKSESLFIEKRTGPPLHFVFSTAEVAFCDHDFSFIQTTDNGSKRGDSVKIMNTKTVLTLVVVSQHFHNLYFRDRTFFALVFYRAGIELPFGAGDSACRNGLMKMKSLLTIIGICAIFKSQVE